MKKYFIVLVCLANALSCLAQGDSKSVREAIQKGTIKKIRIITDSTFRPGEFINFDIEVEAEDGSRGLASEKKIIWKEAGVFLHGALEQTQGKLKTFEGDYFYPRKPLTILVELANAKDSIGIYPSYCYEKFYLLKEGRDGPSGPNGMSGSDGFSSMRAYSGNAGSTGANGTNGPTLNVSLDEEEIGGKLHLIINVDGQKYPVMHGCGEIKVQSKGGDGGEGGDGGSGGNAARYQGRYRGSGGYGGRGGNGGSAGNGGDLLLSGTALSKYADRIEVVSIPGKGGHGGRGGYGGSGFYTGRSGDSGSKGADGQSGKVVRTDLIQKEAELTVIKTIPTTIVVTTDIPGILFIDGNNIGKITPGKPTKLLVSPGKVDVEVKAIEGNEQYFKQILDVAAHQQLVQHITGPKNNPSVK